ncbi:MAG: hypothetical protein Q4P66_05530 [Actinomycetaceae bacterium]|nr:hypothetical protein [Actinomycetaceae bacterium]
MMSIVFPYLDIAGYIGAVFFLTAFAALNLRVVTSESYSYQIANCLGAICFTYSAFDTTFNWGLFITEAVWACIAAYGVFNIIQIKKKRAAGK